MKSHIVKSIDGRDVNLDTYRGKVMLVVNVASECGLTPQYAGLQKLHETYGPKGLAVCGFPANEFGRQEPGSNEQIRQFCTTKFNVDFDMFAKVVVKGDGQCDLYRELTTTPGYEGDISWNFEKFVIDKQGNVVARFEPKTPPDDADLVSTIEAALDK